MHRHDHLTSIGMTPFLVAARLPDEHKTVLSQNSDNFFAVANWVAVTHGSATSNILALLLSLIGPGSNQRLNASFALEIASSSVSPADAQPGNSGKTADHRLVSGSNSTSKRNVMVLN
jgi:hypothetical protein